MHLYVRDSSERVEDDKAANGCCAAPDMEKQTEFHELPATFSLPAPIRETTKYALQMPRITTNTMVQNVHIVTVDRIRHNEWIPKLLGKNGERIKRYDRQYGTKTKIDTDRPDNIDWHLYSHGRFVTIDKGLGLF